MLQVGWDVVGEERTANASLGVVGTEHEVVDDELLAAFEEVWEVDFTVGAFEGVVFFDFDVGELTAQGGEFVVGFGEGFLFLEEGFAGCHPLFACCSLCGVVRLEV